MSDAAPNHQPDGGLRERVRTRLRELGLPGDEMERALFNKAIRRCKFNAAPCCWENVVFCDCYRSSALSAIGNAPAVLAALESGASAADVVLKTPQEMRPDIWDELVRKKRERDSAYGARPAANTNMYRCRRCQSRECHYFGLQTRSGDEPMTIFISCLNCGNRWRTEG